MMTMNQKPFTDKMKMTPLEISEYKLGWKSKGYVVDVHSDLDVQCKDWCRKNLNRWEWSMDKWSGVYSHRFFFEFEEYAYQFRIKFKDWVDKGKD
jgi:hypothetical protein